MAKREITKVEESSMLAVPSYVTAGADGLENMRSKDLTFPRIVLMQGLSPAVKDREANPGDMFNSVSEELICPVGEERLFVPIKHWIEWIEWVPRTEGGGIKAISRDPLSDLARRCEKGEKIVIQGKEVPAITEYHTFLVVFTQSGEVPNIKDAVCLSCGKTNHKIGRKLLSLARMRGNFPLFAGMYSLGTKEEVSNGNDYFTFSVRNNGWASKEYFDALKKEYENLKSLNVMADATESEHEVAAEDTEL